MGENHTVVVWDQSGCKHYFEARAERKAKNLKETAEWKGARVRVRAKSQSTESRALPKRDEALLARCWKATEPKEQKDYSRD